MASKSKPAGDSRSAFMRQFEAARREWAEIKRFAGESAKVAVLRFPGLK